MKPEVLKSWSLEIDYSRAPCLGADQKARGLWERDCSGSAVGVLADLDFSPDVTDLDLCFRGSPKSSDKSLSNALFFIAGER